MCKNCVDLPAVVTSDIELALFLFSPDVEAAVNQLDASGLTPEDFDRAGINAIDVLYRVGNGESPAEVLADTLNPYSDGFADFSDDEVFN